MIEKTDIGDLKGIGEKTKKLFVVYLVARTA